MSRNGLPLLKARSWPPQVRSEGHSKLIPDLNIPVLCSYPLSGDEVLPFPVALSSSGEAAGGTSGELRSGGTPDS